MATHPALDGIYIGATYQSLDNYLTTSKTLQHAVEVTGIHPTFEILETYKVDFEVEDDSNRQVIYQREREIFLTKRSLGALLINKTAPTGYQRFVTRAHIATLKGVPKTAIHIENLIASHLDSKVKAKRSKSNSKAKKGVALSDTQRLNISEGLRKSEKARIANQRRIGTTLSPEHRQKISHGQKTGKRNTANRKVISMLDGRVTTAAHAGRFDKKNVDYVGTWVDL